MSVNHDPSKRSLRAANDNAPEKPNIVINIPKNLPITIVEVELFDRLIFNLRELTANDEKSPQGD